jgi:hypothetical protein
MCFGWCFFVFNLKICSDVNKSENSFFFFFRSVLCLGYLLIFCFEKREQKTKNKNFNERSQCSFYLSAADLFTFLTSDFKKKIQS